MNSKRLSQPYNKREILQFIRNHLFGPWKKYQGLTNFIPENFTANSGIKQQLKIGFIGDIMSFGQYEFLINKSIKAFFSDCDYLVGNFEGLLTQKKRRALFQQIHSEKTLTMIYKIFTVKKTIICCDNNNSADLGLEIFNERYNALKDYGY